MATMGSSQRLVLLATGVDSEPRGAWFEPAHAVDLVQAAGQGGLHLVEVEAHALRSLDPTIAAGHLMAPGQPSPLPPMRAATFNVLVALPGIVAPPRQLTDPDQAARRGTSRRAANGKIVQIPRRRLKVGSVVLASEDVAAGWFEAEIVAIGSDGHLHLRWRDYPDEDTFLKEAACVTGAPAGGAR